MKKLFLLLLMVLFISPAMAKNEVKQAVKNADRVMDQDRKGDWDDRDRDDWDDDLRKDLKKGGNGGGKPNNPGAHGRANAEYKKATNPGKGGGKKSGAGGALLDELIDDDDHKGGKKKK